MAREPDLRRPDPSAQAWVTRRTTGSAFTTPVPVGGANSAAIGLAASLGGSGALALQTPAGTTNSIVAVSTRPPGGAFGTPEPVSAPAFLSPAFAPSAAVDGAGETTVTWTAGGSSGGPFAITSSAPGTFAEASPQALGGTSMRLSLQAAAVAVGPKAVVAWVDAAGGHVSRAG